MRGLSIQKCAVRGLSAEEAGVVERVYCERVSEGEGSTACDARMDRLRHQDKMMEERRTRYPTTKKYTTAYPCTPNLATFPAFRIPHHLASAGKRL
jgi:hypothetical protein